MQSKRRRDERQNQGVFISGATGSGKSRMMQRLASVWKRVITIDPTGSFDVDTVARDFTEARDILSKRWREAAPFNVACMFTNDDEYAKLFGAIFTVARHTAGTAQPICLAIDEVDLWSSPRQIEKNLSSIIRYGRHYGISWIAACRADVQTHRDIRMNATETLLFQQGMLSPEMRMMVASAGKIRGEEMPEVFRLKKHGPKEPELAIEGTHFVAVPDTFDEWFPSWVQLAGGKA